MKICFIMYQGNMYSGGQGVYLHYVTRELARLGHEVHVIAGRPYPEAAEGVHLHKLKTFSFWSFLDGRDEYVFETNPLLFFHPVNLYEFASTRATLSSLLLMFSLRAHAKLNELDAQIQTVEALDPLLWFVGSNGIPVPPLSPTFGTEGTLLLGERLAEFYLALLCPADFDGDGEVGVIDFLTLLAAWGCDSCAEDLTGDGTVDIQDFLVLLAAWGQCP